MRIVALEEHFASRDMIGHIPDEALKARGWPSSGASMDAVMPIDVYDLGAKRLASLDDSGITLEVLSVAGPGAELLDEKKGVEMARIYNDRLAETMREHPTRFAGFAHLPMSAPEAAADEMERAVRDMGFVGALINGTTADRFLDHPSFEPILARAEALDVPIYLHPNLPPRTVMSAYYDGLPDHVGLTLSTAGWGWHSETAIHILRLVLSGTLDRHPKLKLIVGHMGEGFPMMLTRMDDFFTKSTSKYLQRSVSTTILDQVWITTSGFFSLPPFLAALTAFGPDRILFSVDYPFSDNARATRFLDQLPVSPADLEKIAHLNADRLLKLKP